MSAAENKKMMQDVFAEMERGNPRAFANSLSDDVKWRIIGTTAWSRTFNGKQEVLTGILGPLSAQIDGPIRVVPTRFIAEDDFVVIEAEGRNTTRDGVAYNNTYCWVCRLEDGKVKEMTEYLDTELVTAALKDPRS